MRTSFALGDCKICRGLSKTVCMFCGEKRPKKKDMSERDKIRLDGFDDAVRDLNKLHRTLKNLKMASTGDFDLDQEIRKKVGDWGQLSRGTVRAADGDNYTVQLDTGLLFTVNAPHRDAVVGQRVTVRFDDGKPSI